MTELETDPSVVKLLEYAKAKKKISYDEVNDFLPGSIVNSDKIEEVLSLLENNNVKLEDEPDIIVPDAGQLVFVKVADKISVQVVFSFGGRVQASQKVHQGGLAGS